jgi:hypothetical protein
MAGHVFQISQKEVASGLPETEFRDTTSNSRTEAAVEPTARIPALETGRRLGFFRAILIVLASEAAIGLIFYLGYRIFRAMH